MFSCNEHCGTCYMQLHPSVHKLVAYVVVHLRVYSSLRVFKFGE